MPYRQQSSSSHPQSACETYSGLHGEAEGSSLTG